MESKDDDIFDASRLSDANYRRSKLYEVFKDSKDPMWREIGEKLHDGSMTPREMMANDAYRDHIMRGFEENKASFMERLNEFVEDLDDRSADE